MKKLISSQISHRNRQKQQQKLKFFALYWQVTKMAFVNPFFVKNPLIDKPRKSCFFALEMKNKKSAPRKERKNISSEIYDCISTEKQRKVRSTIVKYKNSLQSKKIGIRESLVNDHRRPHLVYFMMDLTLISDAHQRHPKNVMGFDENVRTSTAFYMI